MSPEIVVALVLIGCVVGGAIGATGVVVGLVVGRRITERPRVRCVVSDWDLKTYGDPELPGRAICSFEVDLFNEGMATGLRGPSVAFYGEDGSCVAVGGLKDAASQRDLWALDLPSRRWTHASVYAVLEGGEARDASAFRQVRLVGGFPDGRTFERKVVERHDYLATRKMAGDARHDYVASTNLRSRLLGRRRDTG